MNCMNQHREFPAFPALCVLLFAGGMLMLPVQIAAGVNKLSVSTAGDEYAATLFATQGGTELWFTRSDGVRDRELAVAEINHEGVIGPVRSMGSFFKHRAVSASTVFEPVSLNGCPAFVVCPDTTLFPGLQNYGVFVSDREYGGNFNENDLYECRYGPSGWTSARLDDLCSPDWDDTPHISADGAFLLFSSDRRRPYSGMADIYISHRKPDGIGWGAPLLVAEISTDQYGEQSPVIGPDGYLYYCSNAHSSFDIWRIRFDSNSGAVVSGAAPEKWMEPDVNTPNADELHPFFTYDGRICLFSSNRDGGFDLFQSSSDDTRPDLVIKCVKKACDSVMQDGRSVGARLYEEPYSGDMSITDVAGGAEHSFTLPSNGILSIPWRDIIGMPSLFVAPPRTFRIQAANVAAPMLSSSTLLTIDARCSYPDTVFVEVVDPTPCEYISCALEVGLMDTRMFVNAYWCATTKVYADYHGPCISVFDEAPFRNLEDAVGNSDCIDFVNRDKFADEYADVVDGQIPILIQKIRSAFQQPCFLKALQQKKHIDVKVIGYTDSHGYESHCKYAGHPIVYSGNSLSIEGTTYPIRFNESSSRSYSGLIDKGEPFRDVAVGNQLLSDLRGIHFAIFLDSLLKDSIDIYRLNRQGERPLVRVVAEGHAYRPVMPGASDAAHRSVIVELSVPESKDRKQVPVPAQDVTVGEVCDCKLAARPSE